MEESIEIGKALKAQDHHLVVIHAFGAYRKGDTITDADEIADVLVGDNQRHVNKVRAS